MKVGPPGDLADWVHPQRWIDMEAHRLWGVARSRWLDEREVPRFDRLRPPYAVVWPRVVHAVDIAGRSRK